MPKEVIRRPDPDVRFEVEVGWSHDSPPVQVSVAGVSGHSLNWLLHAPDGQTDDYKHDRLRELGQAFVKCIAEEGSPLKREPLDADDETIGRAILNALDVHGPYRVISAHIDRDGCNDLIRVLRRAREAAFGRDE